MLNDDELDAKLRDDETWKCQPDDFFPPFINSDLSNDAPVDYEALVLAVKALIRRSERQHEDICRLRHEVRYNRACIRLLESKLRSAFNRIVQIEEHLEAGAATHEPQYARHHVEHQYEAPQPDHSREIDRLRGQQQSFYRQLAMAEQAGDHRVVADCRRQIAKIDSQLRQLGA